MKFILFFVSLNTLFFVQDCISGHYTVAGNVKDVFTGRPISFASVSVADSHIGTVTNLDGAFTLKIPVSSDMTGIIISHIGYRVADFNIADLTGEARDFTLEPYSVSIQEVVVKPTDARSIVESAIKSTRYNYPLVSYRLTGFYRETIRQRRDYVSISEAVVDIYQAPYNSGFEKDMFRIVQGRKSGNVKKEDTLIVKLQGGPHVSMLLDIVKNPDLLISEENINFYSFDLVDEVMIDEVANYVISFRPRIVLNYPLYYGKLYISVDRFAITMAEFSLDLTDSNKAAQSFILKKPVRLRFNPVSTRYVVKYKEVDGLYHVNYMRYELGFFADWRRRLFRTGYTIVSEMAITNRSAENVNRISNSEAFRPTAIFADEVPVYFDDEFWGEYNYIEPDQSIYTAITRLNNLLER